MSPLPYISFCLGLKSIQFKNLNLKLLTCHSLQKEMGEELPSCIGTCRMQGTYTATITIMDQQQFTDFFSEFSLFFLPHHLLILTNDIKLILVKANFMDLIVKIEEWNKIIPLCQDLCGKVEFSLNSQMSFRLVSSVISGTMPHIWLCYQVTKFYFEGTCKVVNSK